MIQRAAWALLALVLVAAVGAWLALPLGSVGTLIAPVATAPAVDREPRLKHQDAHAPSVPSAPSAPAAPVALPASASAATAAAPASSAVGDSYWDLCGVGRVPQPPGSKASDIGPDALQNLPTPIGTDAALDAMVRMHAALPGQGPRGQALALLMEGAPQDALVALAQSSADPAVMQWALLRCHDKPVAGGCASLSPRDLTRIDPDNAMAWLLLAAREPKAEAEWWQGLMAATRVSNHAGAMAAAAWKAVPADAPAYLRVPLVVQVIGIEAALPDPTLAVVLRSCRPPQTARRQAECAALAELMVASGETFTHRSVGIRLGEFAGWTKDRTQALRRDTNRLMSVMTDTVFTDRQPFSCASVDRMGLWIQ